MLIAMADSTQALGQKRVKPSVDLSPEAHAISNIPAITSHVQQDEVFIIPFKYIPQPTNILSKQNRQASPGGSGKRVNTLPINH